MIRIAIFLPSSSHAARFFSDGAHFASITDPTSHPFHPLTKISQSLEQTILSKPYGELFVTSIVALP
jgi:hypothetical protein